MNHYCQRQTQVLDLPVTSMIATVPKPSPLLKDLTRHRCFCGELPPTTIVSNRTRSLRP